MSDTDTEAKPRVDSTLSKGLAILEHLANIPSGQGVSEIARALDLTKSNAFRLLQTLTTLGYVARDADKNYRATLKAWQVGRAVVENLNLRSISAELMQHLSSTTGETIYLAVRQDLHVIYIDKVDSLKPIRSWNPIGGSAPIHCVGTGKAILAASYDDLRARFADGLSRHTDRTITSLEDLDQDVARTQTRGYAVDHGEFRDRIYSIGAAIRLPDGSPVGALGVSAPDINIPDGGVEEIGLLVAAAAAAVSEKLALL